MWMHVNMRYEEETTMAIDTFRIKLPIHDLVKEILDQLPDRVWQDPAVRFLDPAFGGGQFVLEIRRRLLAAGHSQKSVTERVWGCESLPTRVKYVQNWFKSGLDNLYVGDPLSYDWGDMKFDVIVGNPPYQASASNGRLGSRGESAIWPRFVETSLSLLKPDGYMGMVHPTSWRKPHDRYGLWNKLTRENSLKRLVMLSGKGAQDTFGIGVRVDWYVLQKTHPAPDHACVVTDHEQITHTINLQNMNWLPNYAIGEISQLLGTGCEVLYNTFYHTQKTHSDSPGKKFKLPVVHTINKDGLGIKYFDNVAPSGIHHGRKKVLLNQNELQYPYNDYKGEYGMSQLTFGIAIKNKKEGDAIVNFLNSDKGKRIIAATKWNTFYTDYGMFEDFKKDWYL
jgi:hypothetical protein